MNAKPRGHRNCRLSKNWRSPNQSAMIVLAVDKDDSQHSVHSAPCLCITNLFDHKFCAESLFPLALLQAAIAITVPMHYKPIHLGTDGSK